MITANGTFIKIECKVRPITRHGSMGGGVGVDLSALSLNSARWVGRQRHAPLRRISDLISGYLLKILFLLSFFLRLKPKRIGLLKYCI